MPTVPIHTRQTRPKAHLAHSLITVIAIMTHNHKVQYTLGNQGFEPTPRPQTNTTRCCKTTLSYPEPHRTRPTQNTRAALKVKSSQQQWREKSTCPQYSHGPVPVLCTNPINVTPQSRPPLPSNHRLPSTVFFRSSFPADLTAAMKASSGPTSHRPLSSLSTSSFAP